MREAGLEPWNSELNARDPAVRNRLNQLKNTRMIVFSSISFECSRSTGTFQVNLLSVLGAIRSHENVRLDVICGCNSEDRERLENAYQEFLQSKIADEVKAMLSEVPPVRDDNTFMPLQAADLP